MGATVLLLQSKAMTGTCRIPDLKMLGEPSLFASWFQAASLDLHRAGITFQPSEFYAAAALYHSRSEFRLASLPRPFPSLLSP
jgi:hypothetical protein